MPSHFPDSSGAGFPRFQFQRGKDSRSEPSERDGQKPSAEQIPGYCRFFQEAIVDTLVSRSFRQRTRKESGSGRGRRSGCNSRCGRNFSGRGSPRRFPMLSPPELCTDNAAMVGPPDTIFSGKLSRRSDLECYSPHGCGLLLRWKTGAKKKRELKKPGGGWKRRFRLSPPLSGFAAAEEVAGGMAIG